MGENDQITDILFKDKFYFVSPIVKAGAVFVYIGSNFFSVEFALDGECVPDLLSGAYIFFRKL